jgi:hypothetical protein
LLTVESTQHHAGADLGLWQTQYPDTKSYSRVYFGGHGAIYQPYPRHDASIIATDGKNNNISSSVNSEALQMQNTEIQEIKSGASDETNP